MVESSYHYKILNESITMDNLNYNIQHRKGQNLLSEERDEIEVARGLVSLYNGKVHRYKVDVGERVYLERRRECRRQYRCLQTVRICFFADCINGLPRKILKYAIPEDLFEQEPDKIYSA